MLRATPIAAVLAAVANAVVYGISQAMDTLPADVLVDTPGGEQAIGLAAVIFATVFPIILGGIVLALLARFTRAPRRLFVIIAVIATLIVMHIVAVVVGVGTFRKDGEKHYWCVKRGAESIVISLKDEEFSRLFPTVDHPRELVDRINATI